MIHMQLVNMTFGHSFDLLRQQRGGKTYQRHWNVIDKVLLISCQVYIVRSTDTKIFLLGKNN